MPLLELERVKAAIAALDREDAYKLPALLNDRFVELGLTFELSSDENDIEPSLRVPEDWNEVEAELARYDAGGKSYGREDLLSLAEEPNPPVLAPDAGEPAPLSLSHSPGK